jgi:UDP-glucuronate decarboxylase
MQRILVTGGAGFIGSSLAEKLSQLDDTLIVIVDNLSTGQKEKIPTNDKNNIKFIKCNVNVESEITSVFHAFPFDYVFHYAAMVGVERTLKNPVEVLKDIDGIKNVLNLSKNTGVKRVFYASSSEVYGEPVEFPQNEDTTPLNSRLPYAIVKNVGEAYLKSFKQEFDLDYTIFRFFNTYGIKQSSDFVISKFIAAAKKGEDITINGDGSQTRTFCYIDDNVEATVNTLLSNDFINDTINIGNNIEVSILDIAKKIIALTNSSSKTVHLPPLKEGDMTRRHPDISKMKKILNRELISLDDGLNKIIKQQT